MHSSKGHRWLIAIIVTIVRCSQGDGTGGEVRLANKSAPDSIPVESSPMSASNNNAMLTFESSSKPEYLFQKGMQLLQQSAYDSAIVYLDSAARSGEELTGWERRTRALYQLGNAFVGKRNLNLAGIRFREAVDCAERFLSTGHPETGEAYYHLAEFCLNRRTYLQAIDYFEQCVEIRKTLYGESDPRVGWIYLKIGAAHSRRANYKEALHNFRRAESILTRDGEEALSDILEIKRALGMTLRDMGQYEKAVESFHESLELAQQQPDRFPGEIAFSYGDIARVYALSNDFDTAVEYMQRALALFTSHWGENNSRLSIVLHDLGDIHARMGNHQSALDYFEQACDLLVQKYGKNHFYPGLMQSSIGISHLELGRFDEAMLAFTEALEAVEPAMGAGHPYTGRIRFGMAGVFAQGGDQTSALREYRNALKIFEDIYEKKHTSIARCHAGIATLCRNQGDYRNSLTHLQHALQALVPDFDSDDYHKNPVLRNIFSLPDLLDVLGEKAETLLQFYRNQTHDLADLECALASSYLAAELVQQMRIGFRSEGAKFSLSKRAKAIHDQGILIALQLHRHTGNRRYLVEAFNLAEMSKSGILRESISRSRARQFAGIPDHLLENERQLRIRLAHLEESILHEEQQGVSADSVRLSAWRQQTFALKLEYERLQRRFEREYPHYFKLKYGTQTTSIEDLSDILAESGSTVVSYITGSDSLIIFVVTAGGVHATVTPHPVRLRESIEELRRGITGQDYPLFVYSASQLYETLLLPVQNQIGSGNIIFIPDGLLGHVPFEVLLSAPASDQDLFDYSTLSYLIRDHAVSYAYSATLLVEAINRPESTGQRDLFACAPEFPDSRSANSYARKFVAANRGDKSFNGLYAGNLPAARDEVRRVEALFLRGAGLWETWFGDKTLLLQGENATESRLKGAQLNRYRYLHLATHGFVNESRPELSGLLLAEGNAAAEDGVLHLMEIYNFDLNAELVVLSSCESGLGQIATGEGLIGLSRGFLYAGAKNLIVSLWQVADRSTANLMVRFYAGALNGLQKSDALRQAKLHMISERGKYARPLYWAPFILIGE